MNIRRLLENGTYELGVAHNFNIHGLGEVVCYFNKSGCESEFIEKLEVKLQNGTWKPLQKAFADRDIIPNNLSTEFDFPHSDTEREQGFYY